MQDSGSASVEATSIYEALPESERHIGVGSFGSVKKVRRTADLKVSGAKAAASWSKWSLDEESIYLDVSIVY